MLLHMNTWASAEGDKGGVSSWTFMYDTANVFFNKHWLCETLTNNLSCLLRWLMLKGRGN